jgi:hypothetical protein
LENLPQHPANPKVLLHNDGQNVELRGRLTYEGGAFDDRQLSEQAH